MPAFSGSTPRAEPARDESDVGSDGLMNFILDCGTQQGYANPTIAALRGW
jgi:hypothetical protein